MHFSISVKGMPFFVFLKKFPTFLREYAEIRRQAEKAGKDFPFAKLYPCLEEKDEESGIIAEHYFLQDLLVAQKIFQINRPSRHVDIGSRIDGFVGHVASFREVEVFDVRGQNLDIANIRFTRADLTAEDFSFVDYCDSLSCLHAMEHFGLGRYGDRLNYRGHLVGWDNMFRMLKQGGKFYFSVPIGEQRIEFNAHRVFSVAYLLRLMEGRYDIDSFSYINNENRLITHAVLDERSVGNNFGCHYGCGIFELTKR
jgi:SAM-dependent methyltransferase